MRHFRILAILATVTMALVSCNDVDPIHGTKPEDPSYSTGFPLSRFHELGQAGDTTFQRQLVDEYRKLLTANVVRHFPEIQNEQNIRFVLGSWFAKDVKSGDSKTYSGKFKNELIVIVDDPAVKDTLFLACGNGLVHPLKFKDYHDFGTAEQWRYKILPGQGLTYHLPRLQAWAEVARDLRIPIRDKNGNIVFQGGYLHYLRQYESVLFLYDVVDILNCKVYNNTGQVVDFDCRQEETERANAETANARAKKQPRARLKRNRRR